MLAELELKVRQLLQRYRPHVLHCECDVTSGQVVYDEACVRRLEEALVTVGGLFMAAVSAEGEGRAAFRESE